ncbi:trimeric intracellular cation channel family protein [Halobacteriovorax sp.]|uniref:trimeric intracellular cation channel family protein n=1 Tax=Halobacteriovorax sp. TaxID=2020862 RepID=UPI0035666D3C
MSEIFIYIDYVGTVVFSITGSIIAGKAKFDFFGMLFLAFLTAVGGGTVRDLIISDTVFWTLKPVYLYLIFGATLSTFFLIKVYEKYYRLLLFFDTLGVGTFVVIGTHQALRLGFNNETAFIMGTMTAVLGGILRSSFSKEFSILLNKELYATVAALASILFITLSHSNIDINYCAVITIVTTFILRYGSRRFKIYLPVLKD